jgi:hypothetical protein
MLLSWSLIPMPTSPSTSPTTFPPSSCARAVCLGKRDLIKTDWLVASKLGLTMNGQRSRADPLSEDLLATDDSASRAARLAALLAAFVKGVLITAADDLLRDQKDNGCSLGGVWGVFVDGRKGEAEGFKMR